jgi:hypothetical protein
MTALILHATPFVEIAAPKLRTFFRKLSETLDAFAMYRMQQAVPECELRRTDREINRYRRLMDASNARQVRTNPTAVSSTGAARSMQMR